MVDDINCTVSLLPHPTSSRCLHVSFLRSSQAGQRKRRIFCHMCLLSYEPAASDLRKRQHRHRRVIGDWQRQLIWEPFLSLCNIVLAHANENKTVDGCPNITESFYLTSVDDDNLHVQWSNTVRLCFSALLHLYLDSLYLPR